MRGLEQRDYAMHSLRQATGEMGLTAGEWKACTMSMRRLAGGSRTTESESRSASRYRMLGIACGHAERKGVIYASIPTYAAWRAAKCIKHRGRTRGGPQAARLGAPKALGTVYTSPSSH